MPDHHPQEPDPAAVPAGRQEAARLVRLARTMSPYPGPGRAEDHLAALRRRHPGWDVWFVPSCTLAGRGAFCAKPARAGVSVCQAATAAALTAAIDGYEARLPDRIAAARARLTDPELSDHQRPAIQRQLDGMTHLRDTLSQQARSTAAANRPQAP